MLSEVVYWTHRALARMKYYREQSDAFDVAFIVSILLVNNLLCIIYILEYYTSWVILKYVPIKGRGDFKSWLVAVLMLAPFVIFIYCRYTKRNKMQVILKASKEMSERRLFWGRLLFVLYVLVSVIGFGATYQFFKH